jgi:hypothetical protein
MARNNPQLQNRCFFCGGAPLTEEHILPAWLDRMVGVHEGDVHRIRQKMPLGEEFISREKYLDIPFLRVRVKMVCARCNNEWMSRLETLMQPTLMALIFNQKTRLNGRDAGNLSRWAIKTCMMRAAWENRDGRIFPQGDREMIKNGRDIPDGYSVHVAMTTEPGLLSGNWAYSWIDAKSRQEAGGVQGTIQIGHMLMLTTYAKHAADARATHEAMSLIPGVQPIWPLSTKPVFPANRMLTRDERDYCSEYLRRYYKSVADTGDYLAAEPPEQFR